MKERSPSAKAVANFIIDEASALGVQLSNLSIQKILYFCHGWHTVRFKSPLINENFEAWKFGPVIKSVYHSLKQYGDQPVTEHLLSFDVDSGVTITPAIFLPEPQENFLREVVRFYARIPASRLVEMTHGKGSPWHKVWNAPASEQPVGLQIDGNDIIAYFQSLNTERRSH